MSRSNRPTASQRARNQLFRNRANRENIEYAEMERVEISEAQRRWRENALVRDAEQGLNTASHRSRRLNPPARAVQEANTWRRSTRRQNSQVRVTEQALNTAEHLEGAWILISVRMSKQPIFGVVQLCASKYPAMSTAQLNTGKPVGKSAG